jgi:hypothetical protein
VRHERGCRQSSRSLEVGKEMEGRDDTHSLKL